MDMSQKIDVMYNATDSEIKTILCEGFKLNSKEIKRFLIEIEDMCLKFHKRSKDMENKLVRYLLNESFVNLKLNLVNNSIIAQYTGFSSSFINEVEE